MKKTILILALILSLVFAAYAQGVPAEPAVMESSLMEGVVLEILEGEGYLIQNEDMGEIKVLVSEETVFEATHEIAVSDYIYADYNGQMTYSRPPQIVASLIRMHRILGEIIEILPEENAVMLSTPELGEIRVTLPEIWAGQEISFEQMLIYTTGTMTMSLPPQMNAGHVVPGYALQGEITEIGENFLMIGAGMEAVQVNFAADMLAENTTVGQIVRVIHSGQMTRSLPMQVNALAIIQISR